MSNPSSFISALEKASQVANTPFITTIIDKLTGYKLSEWAAESEIRKRLIHDEYDKAKEQGIVGMQYIEYLRKNENLLNVATKSTKYIDPEKSNDIKIDNDFFWNTIEHAKNVSNENVQELLAKILAGEYNRPGSYSIMTLNTLKMLGQSDILLFEKMASFLISDHLIPNKFFTLDHQTSIHKTMHISFSDLQHLQTLGLVLPNTMTVNITNHQNSIIELNYQETPLYFKCNHESDYTFRFPDFYSLSEAGFEILPHLRLNHNYNYLKWIMQKFSIRNYDSTLEHNDYVENNRINILKWRFRV
jgi:hypothetical protein